MKNLSLSLAAFLILAALAAPYSRAEDSSAWSEAFPEDRNSSGFAQGLGASLETGAAGITAIVGLGENSALIERERASLRELAGEARREAALARPDLKGVIDTQRRVDHVEERLKQGGVFVDSDMIKHRELKKEMAKDPARFAEARKLVAEKHQQLLTDLSVPVKPGVMMSPQAYHRRELRNLYFKKFGIAGAALAVAADAALRMSATVSGRDAGYVPAASIISAMGSRPKDTPRAESGPQAGAATSMSVE